MRKDILGLSAVLALTVSLGALPVVAEKGEGQGQGKGKAGARIESRGGGADFQKEVRTPAGVNIRVEKEARVQENRNNAPEAVRNQQEIRREAIKDRNEIRREAMKEQKELRQEVREERREQLREAREDRLEIFRNHRDREKELRREARGDRRDELELGVNYQERVVFVQGVPTDSPNLVLVEVTPDNEDFIVHLIRAHQNNGSWMDRVGGFLPFGRTEVEVGHALPDRLFKKLTLLPMDVNDQLGLPDDDAYRVGVLDNRLVLLDVERRLVLDVIEYSDNDLQMAEVRVPSELLYVYRLNDSHKAEVVAFLEAHPRILERNESFADRFRRVVLMPLGFGETMAIGEPLPSDIEIGLLPLSMNAQLDLPESDLRLGLYGNDLVLIDTRTAVVLDIQENII